MRNLQDIFDLYESHSPSINLDIAVESVMDGNVGSSYAHLKDLFYEELKELPIHKVNRNVFRFTQIPGLKDRDLCDNPVIKNIRDGSITLSNPAKFNDPMDPIIREWLNLQEKKIHSSPLKQVTKFEKNILEKNLRMVCLVDPQHNDNPVRKSFHRPTIEDCSLLMWAHYTGGHKGICIEYEISPESVNAQNDNNQLLRLCDVRYRDRKVMSDYITLDNALLAKSECWKYENETRLIYYSKNVIRDEKNRISDFVSLPGFPIKAIYLGYRISQRHISAILDAVKGKEIPVYFMKFSLTDITKLEAKRLN